VSAEDLVEVIRRQIPLARAHCKGLLGPHHDGIGESPKQHDQSQDDIHDADSLGIETGEPLVPKVRPFSEIGNEDQDDDAQKHGAHHSAHGDGIMVRYRLKG